MTYLKARLDEKRDYWMEVRWWALWGVKFALKGVEKRISARWRSSFSGMSSNWQGKTLCPFAEILQNSYPSSVSSALSRKWLYFTFCHLFHVELVEDLATSEWHIFLPSSKLVMGKCPPKEENTMLLLLLLLLSSGSVVSDSAMDCSMPGLTVLHHFPELAQTHVHWVGDAIQPLSPPSSPAFNLSQHQGLFQQVSSLHQVAKVLEFQLQHQSFQWIFRVDFL